MSFLAVTWAETAPVADVYERAILTLFAHRANHDGTDCYPSVPTIAEFCVCDTRSIIRRLKALTDRKVIALGDQQAAFRIPARYRPKVYDLLIPYGWYSDEQMEKYVNRDRAQRGLPPLDPADRPALALPPSRTCRRDAGTSRPRKTAGQ